MPQGQDDWVVTNIAQVRGITSDTGEEEVEDVQIVVDEGTPIEGVVAAAPPLPAVESSFVAGEIDVPTPPPRRTTDDDKTPGIEILGKNEPDPDTGSRTPPIERR
jgi:hypothetical protein